MRHMKKWPVSSNSFSLYVYDWRNLQYFLIAFVASIDQIDKFKISAAAL